MSMASRNTELGGPTSAERLRRLLDDWLPEFRPQRGERRDEGAILIVEESLPAPDLHAGGRFIWQLIEILLAESRRVVVYAEDRMVRLPYADQLVALGVELVPPTERLIPWLRRNEGRVGAIIVARPEVGRRFVRAMRRVTRAKILYYVHDVHFVRERRRYEQTGETASLRESRRLERIETSLFRRADAVLTPSPAEVAHISHIAPATPVYAVPPFMPPPPAVDRGDDAGARRTIVLLGNYSHSPNVDAATWLIQGIMPIVWQAVGDAQVAIVGADPPPEVTRLAGPRVAVLSHIADLQPVFSGAVASVVPLRYGAGFKGKVLTSLEAGVPVITTTIGNEGIDLVDGEQALIADDRDGFAAHIVRLLQDPALGRRLAVAGHRALLGRFPRERTRGALMAALGGLPPPDDTLGYSR